MSVISGIRAAIAAAHDEIETTRYAVAIMNGGITTSDYLTSLVQLNAIHTALESVVDTTSAAAFFDDQMIRSTAIERDLAYWQVDGSSIELLSETDTVVTLIRQDIAKHAAASKLTSRVDEAYGNWVASVDEMAAVAEFLLASHSPRSRRRGTGTSRTTTVTKPRASAQDCPHANRSAYFAYKRYRWICADCGMKEPMPLACTECGADGNRGDPVRIRKDLDSYTRVCGVCRNETMFWRGPASKA